MRVLHVIGGLGLGGAETLLYRLATHPVADIEHEVICLGKRDWYSQRLEGHGITVHHLGMTSAASTLTGISRLRRLIRHSGADVIHSWMYFANVLSGLLARGAAIPVVWGIHASTFKHLGLPSRLCAHVGGRFATRLSALVINCSARSAEVHARFGYSAVPNAVIPNGYDPARLFPDEQARLGTRGSLGVGGDTFLIGSITRWHSEKDVTALIQAIAILRNEIASFRCLLIGPGLEDSNADLSRHIRDARLHDVVVPMGTRSDIAELARALDLHALPSRSEAFPNVVAETMLSGVPNVVTDVGDSALIVGDSGWVAPPGDPLALADAIVKTYREWRDQPASWERRRAAARQRIVERFTFGRMADAYARVWRELATKG
jgi:glycosyltransferase involved in cell wall biosynthesis